MLGLTFILYVGAFFLMWLERDAELPAGFSYASQALFMLAFVPGSLVGGLITARLPRNPYGWVWLGMGLAAGLMDFTQMYALQGILIAPDSLPLANFALNLSGLAWFVLLGMMPFVLLLFPTGRPPSRRWRFVGWAVTASLLAGCAIGWAAPGPSGMLPGVDNPYGIAGVFGQVSAAILNTAIYVVFLSIPLSAISLILRYRRAVGVERQQLKWLAYSAALMVVVLASDFIYSLPGILESIKEALSFVILPTAVGIAILRYRLYDIDLIIRRTLQYSVISGLLAITYFGIVIVLQGVFTAVSGQQSAVAIVLSTLAIAALFLPLRRRVQDAIDRRFYRKKYDAAKVIAEFAATCRDETDLDKLTARLIEVVQETMQPTHVSLWLKDFNAKTQRREGAKKSN
jgi:hypothetical protein